MLIRVRGNGLADLIRKFWGFCFCYIGTNMTCYKNMDGSDSRDWISKDGIEGMRRI